MTNMVALEQLKRARRAHSHGPAEPLAHFTRCHENMLRLFDGLERAGEVLCSGMRDEKTQAFFALDMARAHFAGPAMLHTEDEEASLFPRLRLRGGVMGQEALAAVRELESEHRTAEIIQREFESLAARVPRDGTAYVSDLQRINEVIAVLSSLYRPHIAVENQVVFPAAERLLRAEDVRQVGAEMQARRALRRHAAQVSPRPD